MRSISTALLALVLFGGFATGASAHSDTVSKPIATSKTSEPPTTPNSDNSRSISSYDLNNPDDVKAFWEQRTRNGK
jgi:hypothetical protein